MELFFFLSVLVWAFGGWITGLIMKSAGIKMKGGYLLLMLLGWGLAGVIALYVTAFASQGFISGGGFNALLGLTAGAVGGIVTIRQIAKARKKKAQSG